MAAIGMNHFTVIAKDLDQTVEFYREILNLEVGFRPDLGSPGAWLYIGENAVLHILSGKEFPKEPEGVLDHMAFTSENINRILTKLKAQEINFSLKRQPQTNTWQLFFKDPNGAKVELDFPATEKPPTNNVNDND